MLCPKSHNKIRVNFLVDGAAGKRNRGLYQELDRQHLPCAEDGDTGELCHNLRARQQLWRVYGAALTERREIGLLNLLRDGGRQTKTGDHHARLRDRRPVADDMSGGDYLALAEIDAEA